jgi:dihydrofolate synthase/folylpolyglutamate synthase
MSDSLMNYDETLHYLDAVTRTGIKYNLINIRRLLEILDHPEKSFPVVCVAGTNGKGSICAFLESILTEAGYRAGLNTSPHLVTPRERIRINRVMTSREEFAAALSEVRAASESAWRPDDPSRPTFFETMTSAALCHFRNAAVDLAILEAGLGGRLDGTNGTQPSLSVITRIAIDHHKTLGNNLHKIAFEKTGICRPGRPLLIGPQKPYVRRHLTSLARFRGAMPVQLDSRWEQGTKNLTLITPRRVYTGIRLSLPGAYQRENAACAVRAAELLESLGFKIGTEAVIRGLGTAFWPARLEINRIDGHRVLIDSSHNPDGVGRFLRELKAYPAERKLLIYGTMADKDFAQIVPRLFPRFDRIFLPALPQHRAAEPSAVLALARRLGLEAEPHRDIASAWNAARNSAHPDDLIVVTGSIYLAGEFLKLFTNDR